MEIIKDMIDNHACFGTDKRILDRGPSAIPAAVEYHAKIAYHAAELAEVSSYKLEVLTNRLYWLTMALVGLTAVLAVFTLLLLKHGC